jgi:hypothetical protein
MREACQKPGLAMSSSQWMTGAKLRVVVGARLCYVVGCSKVFEPLLVAYTPISIIIYPPARWSLHSDG